MKDAPASLERAAIGIIAGGGVLPFTVADQLQASGRKVAILALRGFCDADRVRAYRHHWITLGKFGQIVHLLRQEDCTDVLFLGALIRPALSEIRLDWGTLKAMPQLMKAFRGGDDHLLGGVARLFEAQGFRLIGVAEATPCLTMPSGTLTRTKPDAASLADAARGIDLLCAMSPFDVGQGAIVIDGNVVCVEDIEGTDAMLARAARLRRDGRLRTPAGRGVLVKMPKVGQNLKFDLPTVGSRTVEGARDAGLAGIATIAGQSLFAEAQDAIAVADKAGLFIVGLPA